MTNLTTIAALAAACASLCACGGSSAPPPPPAPAPAPATFTWVAPALGSASTWNRTLTDSAGTRETMQIRQTVSAVHEDGSLVYTYDDPTGTQVSADGLLFRTTPETANVSARGSTLDYTVTSTTGAQTTCVYAYPGGAVAAELGRARALGLAHVASLQVGESWQTSYTIACGSDAPVTYSVTAAVYPVETVTVPAGTFQAFRETVSEAWTSGANGQFSNGAGITSWRETSGSLQVVKLDESIVHGDTSRPWFTHETRELASHTP